MASVDLHQDAVIGSVASASGHDAIRDEAYALERMQLALQVSRIGLWDWNLITGEVHLDARARMLWGLSSDMKASFELFQSALHPQDRKRVKDAVDAALDLAHDGDYEIECRVIGYRDRVERWIALRGRTFFESGQAVRVLGTARDITERKDRERHVRVLLRELVHRSRNLLAVVHAMARRTATGATSLEEFQGKFNARLQALAMAHDLLISQEGRGASLHDLVRAELAYCFDTACRPCGGACAQGPKVMLKPEATQNIGLALHELATNALAYGALARADGCVALNWRLDDERLIIEWRESGGPAIATPPRVGFGHLMVKRVVAQALDGTATVGFPPGGFVWTLSVPAASALANQAHHLSAAFSAVVTAR